MLPYDDLWLSNVNSTALIVQRNIPMRSITFPYNPQSQAVPPVDNTHLQAIREGPLPLHCGHSNYGWTLRARRGFCLLLPLH